MKAYLALNNKIMKKFITECKIFDINDNINDEYDIMFCDTLELGKNIKSDKKIYLACHYFEHLYDLSKYSNYDYFIGFGEESLYEFLYNHCDLEVSTVLNGFVNSELDQEYNIEEDYIVSFMEEKYNNESLMYNYSKRCSKPFLQSAQMAGLKIFFNHPFPVAISSFDNTKWIDDISIKMLSNSSIFFTDSVLNCRLYFNSDILKKTILSTKNYHAIKNFVDNSMDFHIQSLPAKIKGDNYFRSIESIFENGILYKEIYRENIFNDYKLKFYNFYVLNNKHEDNIEKYKINIKKTNKDKNLIEKLQSDIDQRRFLIYNQDFSNMSFSNGMQSINLSNIICINYFLHNFDKLSNKHKKYMKINDISDEFLNILEKI